MRGLFIAPVNLHFWPPEYPETPKNASTVLLLLGMGPLETPEKTGAGPTGRGTGRGNYCPITAGVYLSLSSLSPNEKAKAEKVSSLKAAKVSKSGDL